MTTPKLSPTLISSIPDLLAFLSSIPPSRTLYLDLEGSRLSRNGTLSIITVLVHPTRVTSLIDVQTLGSSAFTASSADGTTLKAILEDPHTPKYFWDVRNDADALWAHYQVQLAGITDVQLLENASRPGDKTYVRGLDTCIEKDLRLKFMEVHRLIETNKEIMALMPNNVFARRPLDAKTMQYCVNGVIYLPQLHDVYASRIDSHWIDKAANESASRVVDACSLAYEPQSETKKLGPWGSGLDGKVLMDACEWLERLEEDRMDSMQQEMFGIDGYSDFEECDDYPRNAYDAAWDDTFDSCWEK